MLPSRNWSAVRRGSCLPGSTWKRAIPTVRRICYRKRCCLRSALWAISADPSGFRAWLLKIAQNVFLDATRRDARQKRTARRRSDAAALHGVPGKEPAPEDRLAREELRGQVLAILRSLPEEYRLPLTLRYLGGCDYQTIQTQLGLTNGALRGLLHRGLKLLRARLPREFEDFMRED